VAQKINLHFQQQKNGPISLALKKLIVCETVHALGASGVQVSLLTHHDSAIVQQQKLSNSFSVFTGFDSVFLAGEFHVVESKIWS